jgi:hypothetical protein
MSDAFQTVIPGQDVRIPAATWNAMLGAARAHLQRQFDIENGSEADTVQPSTAKVQNQTGVGLDRFAIVGLSQPIIPPAVNLAEFQRQTTFMATLPSGDGRFGVLLEPLAPNAIGLAVVAGVCAARLTLGSSLYDCATPIPGVTGSLLNVPHGPSQVLWMESVGAMRWCLVRIGQSNLEEMVYITSNIPDADGYYPALVQRYDVVTKSWLTQFPCKVLDANQ